MPTAKLNREEYIEQAYFFRTFRERLEAGTASQECLSGIREEILSTTKLPMAIDFLIGELQLNGRIGDGMQKLSHYFLPFQTFIMQRGEDEESRFDFRVGLRILEREAEYRSRTDMQPAALFVFQFECIARNRLGYDYGLLAVSQDPVFNEDWAKWIGRIRFDLGTMEFADLVYQRSEQHVLEVQRRTSNPDYQPSYAILFDAQTGRIANANRGKDPLYMFAALQRQLGFPEVPRPKQERSGPLFDPHIEQRFQKLETKLALIDQELKGGVDLSKFYQNPLRDDGDA